MIKGGKLGSSTKTGTIFENKVNLLNSLEVESNLIEKNVYQLLKDNEEVGLFVSQGGLYKLLNKLDIDYNKVLSKKIRPDSLVFNYKTNTIFIIEIKYQNVNGSVDEKLQTCHYKKHLYETLFNGFNVKYGFLLNDWFKQDVYKNTLDYIEDVDCFYFFNEIPKRFFNL